MSTNNDRNIDEEKIGFFSGLFAEHPLDENIKIPIYFTNYVLINYGTGAIFGALHMMKGL